MYNTAGCRLRRSRRRKKSYYRGRVRRDLEKAVEKMMKTVVRKMVMSPKELKRLTVPLRAMLTVKVNYLAMKMNR